MQRSKKRGVEFLVSKLLLINSRPRGSVQNADNFGGS